MADYGVNIAVAVKNSQAVTQLSNQIKNTAARIEEVNSNFNEFAKMTGNVLPGSITNFNRALSDAARNLSDVALNTDDAVASAREFARAQDLANDALREQAALLAQIRNEGRSGNLRGGTQYAGPIGPGPASATALRSPLPPSVPVALRSPMRPQSLLPQMEMTAQAGKIASDMEEVYASILRLTEQANQEEAQKLQTLRQGTQEVEELAQKYRVVSETRKTEKQIQLEIRRSILETKNAAAEQARVESEAFMDRLRNLEVVGAKRREQFIEFNKNENEKRRIRERELDFERRLAKLQERRLTRRRAAGSALIGGAFPLLFGQGPGAAIGGGVGGFAGGTIGGEFGFGLSLIGTQLGSIVDEFVNKINSLAGSLSSTESIFSALEGAGFKVNETTMEIVASYEQAGLFADAYQLAIDELNSKLGDDGAAKLQAYQDELDRVGNLFEELQSNLMAELLPALTGTLRLILGLKNAFDILAESPLFKALASAGKVAAFANPGLAFTGIQFRAIQALGAADGDVRVPDSVRRKQEAGREAEIADEQVRNEIARERGIILDKQLELAIAGNDLLNKDVQLAKEKLIDEKYLAAVRGNDVTLGEKILAGKQRALDLQKLANEISAAETAELERQERKQRQINKNKDIEDRKRQRAIERQIKAADTEIERATKAFERADSQLDDIINKNKDKVAFEREYAELIRSGSTPAAAKQVIELKKQQLELDRNYEKLEEQLQLQVKIAQAAIVTAKARGASGAELDELNQAMADLLDKIGQLPGKKEDAEGAILEALAPKSDRDRLQEYLDAIQGQLNDLNDPVKQIIGFAETLGGAFAESFKGIVDGSMSAREALANLFQRTADHFLNMAAEMIAAQIKMKILGIGLNFLSGGIGSPGNFEQGLGFGGFSSPSPTDGIDFGAIFGRANGGAVGAGRPYLVGERGPELFVPGAQGNIVPNNAMGGANIVVNVDASGTQAQGNQPNAKALGSAIGAAVQAELIKQKRPGGLLA